MAILDPRYQFGYTELTDLQLSQLQTSNAIRPDAILVRTWIGGAVWIDPNTAYTNTVTQYRTGVLRGDEGAPAGVLLVALPTPVTGIQPIQPTPFNGFIPPVPAGNVPAVVTVQSPITLSRPVTPNVVIPTSIPVVLPPPPPPTTNSGLYLTIRINVLSAPAPVQKTLTINLTIKPAIPAFAKQPVTLPWTLQIKPIPLPLTEGIIHAYRRLIDGKIPNYFDQDRVGKTLLNFGHDYQAAIINWQYDPSDATHTTALVKLYEPLPADIKTLTELWIVRELAPTLLDQLFVVYIPGEGLKLYLRPPNRDINVQNIDGNELNNVTLQTLFTTGSISKTNLRDPILEEWYVTSLEGAELNIKYNDFSQFVFYGSAVARLSAFRQKLLILEDYNSILSQQSASIAAATSLIGLSGFTGSMAYAGYQRLSEQRIELIRGFDGYERFLYYTSGSEYSSSFSGDGGAVDQLYYLNDATWPKISGSVITIASASDKTTYSVGGSQFTPHGDYSGVVSWWDSINYIAEEYDNQNINRLVSNLPSYLQDDSKSSDFIKFVDMIGHHFDSIKVYADRMPDLHDRDSDPTLGLSPDLIWHVASSLGVDLPNQYAIKQLVDYTIGELGVTNPTVYRQMAAETWKRFLHNQMYLLKTKGTRNALRGLLNSYGVLPTTIQIRESSTPSYYTTQSYELIEEQTNVLSFANNSYIKMPYNSTMQTFQTRFATTIATQSILYNVDDAWSIQLSPISSSYGYVSFLSGSTPIASSSIFKIYSGDYYHLTVQKNGATVKMWTQRADDDGDIVDSSYVTASFNSWTFGSWLYLGATGSLSGVPFVGTIDEHRVWSEQTTDAMIEKHVKYPGLYNGNIKTSARDKLLIRLSFNKPYNLGVSASIPNESPYTLVAGTAAIYRTFSVFNFASSTTYPYSMTNITRNILRYAPNTGGSQFVSNKINISDAPTFRVLNDDSGSNLPILSSRTSMVSLNDKLDKTRSMNLVGFYFSLTDAINDNIIRSIGNIDLQDYIGSPTDLYESSYSNLKDLNNLYWTNYAYTFNYNTFINFIESLLRPLFIQAKQLVPVRAKLLTGIVLESPMLERNKIKWNPIDLSGNGTLDQTTTPSFYPRAIKAITTSSISSDYLVHDTAIDTQEIFPIESEYINYSVETDLTSDVFNVDSTYDTFTTTLDTASDVFDVSSEYANLTDTITTQEQYTVASDYLLIDTDTAYIDYVNYLLNRFGISDISKLRAADRPYFNQLLALYKPSSIIVIDTGTNPDLEPIEIIDTINPYVDFSDIGDITYFTRLNGVILIPIQTLVRTNSASLIDAGTWTINSTYTRNQFVIQMVATGSASSGNGYEYECITPLASGSFISRNAPSLDTINWRRIKYTYTTTYSVRIASLVNNAIALTDPTLALPPFNGYLPSHYRFRRDTRLGTLRRIWYGCKNTDSTTIDGKPAVETFAVAGDTLVVTDNVGPIQAINPKAGPILDVE